MAKTQVNKRYSGFFMIYQLLFISHPKFKQNRTLIRLLLKVTSISDDQR